MKQRIVCVVGIGIVAACLCAAQEKSAQPGQAAPVQAGQAGDSGATPATTGGVVPKATQPMGPLYQPAVNDSDALVAVEPNTRPPSGILGLTLGWARANENKVTTSFNFNQAFDSNVALLGNTSDYRGESMLGGSLGLRRANKDSALDVIYDGGVVIYDSSTSFTGDYSSYHRLNLAQSFNVRRWTFTLADDLNYSPQGTAAQSLGLTGLGSGLGAALGTGVGIGGINPLLSANQSVTTLFARQLANSVGGDLQYGLSPRSSVTAGVTYSNVFFPDGGFSNTHQFSVRSGYNRNWTAKDTVSVLYTFSEIRGSGSGFGDLNTHSVQMAYARRVSGRLSWSVSAGPELRQQSFLDNSVSWTAQSGLQYARLNDSMSLDYSHGTTGAAAVGETSTDRLQLGYTRAMARVWNVGVNGSLFRNVQLLGVKTEYRSGAAGVQVRRQLGPHASLNFNYQYQRQISDGVCVGTLCPGFKRHLFAFGFSWRPDAWILH